MKILHFPRGMNKKLSRYSAILAKYKEALNKVSDQTQTPIIDLDQTVSKPGQRDIFTDTMHINTQGAEQYATLISNYILEEVLNGKEHLDQNQ